MLHSDIFLGSSGLEEYEISKFCIECLFILCPGKMWTSASRFSSNPVGHPLGRDNIEFSVWRDLSPQLFLNKL